jgi:hypothetical protein
MDTNIEFDINANEYLYYEDDSEIEQIMEDEKTYYETDKQHNQYVIGVVALEGRRAILDVSVSSHTFYNYRYKTIMDYCYENSSYFNFMNNLELNNKLEILKVRIGKRGEYYVLVKTHWLKIIQRTWKKIYKKRQEQLLSRRNYSSLRHFEIRGRYSEGLNTLVGIHGMLNGLIRMVGK